MTLSIAGALLPLAMVLGYVAARGTHLLSWQLLSQPEPFSFTDAGGGVWNDIKGTLKLLVVASVVAVPTGIGCAVYLTELGRGWAAGAVRFVADVMTGVPSVFVGMFVYSLVVARSGHFSALAGALALALLMLPIVVRGAEEVLLTVPNELREASYALGVPRWRTVVGVVLPTGASGLTTVVMLAVARAAGETAPLLFTSFGNRLVTGWTDVRGPDSALPLLIFRDARSAYPQAQARAWAGALVLVALVLALTLAARAIAAAANRHRTEGP
jgi:phosphate transport system permease protein